MKSLFYFALVTSTITSFHTFADDVNKGSAKIHYFNNVCFPDIRSDRCDDARDTLSLMSNEKINIISRCTETNCGRNGIVGWTLEAKAIVNEE